MEFKVTIPDLPALARDAGDAAGKVQALGTAVLSNITRRVQELARGNAPHRTGALQRSILTAVEYPEGTVTVGERYGYWLENGTAPYDIYPASKKALFWVGAAHPVRHVHHPGIQPRPFFKPAIDEAEAYKNDQFDQLLEIVTKKVAGHGDGDVTP